MKSFLPLGSLRARLLATLLLPLIPLATAIGGGGAWAIHRVVQSSSDSLLGGSLSAICDTLGLEDNQLTLDLPPSALGMLDNSGQDNIYYSVRLDGQFITGYPELPTVDPSTLSLNKPEFRTAVFRINSSALPQRRA